MTTLAHAPLAVLVPTIVLVAALSEATGHRLGSRAAKTANDSTRSHASTVVAACLGLLALLIGFSFSMAVSRYEVRRMLVIREANAIGTTWLRAQMLAAPHDSAAAALLRQYVAVRIAVAGPSPSDEAIAEGVRASHAVQDSLWTVARAVAATDRRMAVISLFTATLNDLIDIDAERYAAFEQRVPAPILWGVILTAWFTMGLGGFATGLGGTRLRWLNVSVAILFSLLIGLIADLDRPRGGYIQTPQQPLFELQASMGAIHR